MGGKLRMLSILHIVPLCNLKYATIDVFHTPAATLNQSTFVPVTLGELTYIYRLRMLLLILFHLSARRNLCKQADLFETLFHPRHCRAARSLCRAVLPGSESTSRAKLYLLGSRQLRLSFPPLFLEILLTFLWAVRGTRFLLFIRVSWFGN